MAAAAWKIYGNAVEAMSDGTIDLDAAGNYFRMILVTSSYSPNQSTDDTYSDLSANEVANGNGYATYGALCANHTWVRSGLAVTFDCDDVSWTSSTITAKYAVIVHDANADGTLAAGDLLLCYSDLNDGGASVSSSSGPFNVNINASGVFTVTAS
jgi:hypothetical protein